jgi:hypothetical protein
MKRIRAGILVFNALLQQAASFRQIQWTSARHRSNIGHSIGKRNSCGLTALPVQWLPSKKFKPVDDVSFILCASASSNSKIDVRPDAEKIDSTIIRSLKKLCGSGSDIRGRFVDHDNSFHSLLAAIQENEAASSQPALTPFATYCIGYSYANSIAESVSNSSLTICIGVDPRTHGVRLAEAFACGVRAYLSSDSRNRSPMALVYTGVASTPACASFVRSEQCDGAVVRLIYDSLPENQTIKLTILANYV